MIGKLLDFFWPRNCEVCGRPVDRPGRHLCSDCLMRIPFVPCTGCCRICGRSVVGLETEYLCEDCKNEKPAFDRAGSVFRYEGAARKLLHGYKFNHRIWMRGDFTDWLEGALLARFDAPSIDAIIPMPIDAKHHRRRGYNQSAYLAHELAKRIDRRFDDKSIIRIGHPARQSDLTEDKRRENVKGTFLVRRPEWIRGRTLLVVDDVMTTGASFSECALTLKNAGAERVYCLSLARSIRT